MLRRSGPGPARLVGLIVILMMAAAALHAQGNLPAGQSANPASQTETPIIRPWWVGVELGDGQLKLTSDQSTGSRRATFEFGLVGGHRLGRHARIGMDVDGWLLQAYPLNDPTRGESVTNVLGLIDVFPIPKIPLFLRAGAGAALYTNNRPLEFGGSGWAWTAGAGYEFPLPRQLGLATIVDFDAGTRGDVNNIITVETGRRYSVVEFKLAMIWHFGRSR
jgi:hypothetical protein